MLSADVVVLSLVTMTKNHRKRALWFCNEHSWEETFFLWSSLLVLIYLSFMMTMTLFTTYLRRIVENMYILSLMNFLNAAFQAWWYVDYFPHIKSRSSLVLVVQSSHSIFLGRWTMPYCSRIPTLKSKDAYIIGKSHARCVRGCLVTRL